MQKLSVVIVVYNQDETAVVHVREAMNASRMPDEIIVVDDCGEKGLKEKLLKLEMKCPLTYARVLEDIPWNYTGARNLGVWLSTGDLISVEDVDNIPSKEAYKDAIKFFEDNPNESHLLYGRRARVFKDMVTTLPSDKWTYKGTRPYHTDTCMIRRDLFLRAKGCDERFAGKYAWGCSDWRRRLGRMGYIKQDDRGHQNFNTITTFFWAVIDAETDVCTCEERKIINVAQICDICKKLVRRKSYENYELASERAHKSKYLKSFRDGVEVVSVGGHTQSPIGMLNFSYEFERL